MALYRNITDTARYICSGMSKVLIEPGQTVEMSERDLAHAGYALANFESVAKAADVEAQRLADLKRANRFVKLGPVDPVPVIPVEAPKPEAVVVETESAE